MPQTQNYRSHARFDPAYHFFVGPVLILNVIVTVLVTVHHWPYRPLLHLWLVVLAVALLFLSVLARTYPLKVQDRVIRLEEQLRYARLLAPEGFAAAQALQVRQIVALRFASDAELPGLLARTLAENLPPKAIKEAVTDWRADTFRV